MPDWVIGASPEEEQSPKDKRVTLIVLEKCGFGGKGKGIQKQIERKGCSFESISRWVEWGLR